ncbi:hypothetical protein Y1Q_0004917 [Alligator mississippiensis]|uniref:Uncharacterized protein n=1 Tax=Alligator mississippiensis TaxID=8496 RepID=A0A151MY75_ALLMI|nr:hypothetical protein Y1Q_0004917 [Alligator mississippiensis]
MYITSKVPDLRNILKELKYQRGKVVANYSFIKTMIPDIPSHCIPVSTHAPNIQNFILPDHHGYNNAPTLSLTKKAALVIVKVTNAAEFVPYGVTP